MKREDFFNLITSKCDLEDMGDVTPDTSTQISDWDSLDVITLLSLFKQEFKMTVNVNDLQNCSSFNDILDFAGDKYDE
ncbi:MAG: acyl carrier protein [Candidatus Gastranaerophilales bacterium]|nr:acyl carrier protein [Candidatus Gastranaerophilales bacterium]